MPADNELRVLSNCGWGSEIMLSLHIPHTQLHKRATCCAKWVTFRHQVFTSKYDNV